MSERSPSDDGVPRRLLVPLADTVTARDAVDHAVASANGGAVHLVVALGEDHDRRDDDRDRAERLLNRARTWAEEDAGDDPLTIEAEIVGTDRYLFGPGDFARVFATYVEAHDLDALVLDPEYWANTTAPLVASFRTELASRDIAIERPATPRPARHQRIVGRWNASKLFTVFAVSLGFYLVLGDPTYWFDLVTGVAVALITALTLSHVTYGRSPEYPASAMRTLRFGLYIPYLVWEIVKANVAVAAVILRPDMPIEPSVTRIRARVGSGLPTLALANSITLTPGTLTVRASSDRLVVHTLIPSAREDLFSGRLERAIRFVFLGRSAAAIATPDEREETEILEADEEW